MQLLPEEDMMVDTRVDGRHRWVGVYLNKEERTRFFRLFSKVTPV